MSDRRPRALGVAVTVVEVVTLLAVALFVVMLFANEPDGAGTAAVASGADSADGAGADGGGEIDGAAVFADRCAVCHGATGEGGVGPTLAGGAVVEAFPDAADQIVVVTEGRNGMPDFGTTLSTEEIDAVVRYTRGL